MADPMGQGTDSAVISDAFVAARELLRRAEEDAAGIRADVDRYVRQREQEAELIVAKARRLLTMAEDRAASMDAGAGAAVPAAVPVAVSVAVDLVDAERAAATADRSQPTAIDGMLAAAIAKAFDKSFPE